MRTTPSTAAVATASFYDRSGPTRLLRFALSGLQDLWPGLAQRLAKQVFLTPLPLKWLQRRGHWRNLTPGSPAHWQVEHWPFERANLTVYRTPQHGGQPTALLLPGWGGSAAQMQPLALQLHAQGWAVLIVEPPGHGRSAGHSSSLPQFERALHYVQGRLTAQGRPASALLAHSLGGSAAAAAVARGLDVQRLVLLAAPDAPQRFTRLFAQVFGLREPARAGMQRRIEAQEAALMSQFDAAHTAPRIAQPTLLVHDRGDSINPFGAAERFAQLLPQAHLHATQGLGHRRLLQDPTVHAAVLAFLKA